MRTLVLIAATLALPLTAAADPATVVKTAMVQVSGEVTVAAPIAKVWSELTHAPALGELTGATLTRTDGTFAKVGDSSPAKIWDDTGRVTVTLVVPEKELRFVFETDADKYVCHSRVRLSNVGGKTRVQYDDRYSDEKPASVDATAKTVAKDVEDRLKKVADRFAKK
jgi:hypothetical protein